jgi:hypothetical protein
MAIEQKPITVQTRVNPYTVPADQQGWRGLGLPDINAHRRSYTVLWNEQVLVCALLLLPGERSIRHSHESGELSITFIDALHPNVSYNPAGMLHGGEAQPRTTEDALAVAAEAVKSSTSPELAELLDRLVAEQRQLRRTVEELRAAPPGPRVLIDILFPPFKTTIDDPAYAEKRTITGPWYD